MTLLTLVNDTISNIVSLMDIESSNTTSSQRTQKYYNKVYRDCEYIVNSPNITWAQFIDKFQIVDEDYYCFILILKFGLSKAKEIINRT